MLLHLMVGLGLLWPVLVVAAWGSGVALTPTEKPRTRSETPEKVAPPERDALDPQVLTAYLSAEHQLLRQAEPPENLRQTMQSLRDCLERILEEWEHLDDYPEHQVIIAAILSEDLPNKLNSCHHVPGSARRRAANSVVASLALLQKEAEEIRATIGEEDIRALEQHHELLQLQFGHLRGPGRGFQLPGKRSPEESAG